MTKGEFEIEQQAAQFLVHQLSSCYSKVKCNPAPEGWSKNSTVWDRVKNYLIYKHKIPNKMAEVAAMTLRGMTNNEIADMLGKSTETVNKHMDGVYMRLNVRGRMEFAAKIIEETCII